LTFVNARRAGRVYLFIFTPNAIHSLPAPGNFLHQKRPFNGCQQLKVFPVGRSRDKASVCFKFEGKRSIVNFKRLKIVLGGFLTTNEFIVMKSTQKIS
jgi:hypothetical protein